MLSFRQKFVVGWSLLLMVLVMGVTKAGAQVPPAEYTGCAGANLSSCNATTYDSSRCLTFIGEDDPVRIAELRRQAEENNGCIPNLGGDDCYTLDEALRSPWTAAACNYQKQGCFVAHPELAGSQVARGVCVLPRATQDYNCANRPASPVCGPEFTVCYDFAEISSRVSSSDCSCSISFTDSQGPGSLCLFRNTADFNERTNRRNFTDAHCPTCPDGFYASSVDGQCWPTRNDATIADRVPITSYVSCTANQRCAATQDGGGCQEIIGGGCEFASSTNGVPTRTCGGTTPYTCTVDDDLYCCQTAGQCVAAGGERTECIQTGKLTQGDFSATSCYSLYPTDFPQLCQVDNWTGSLGVTLEEAKFCCFSEAACDNIDGRDQGITNTRSLDEYEVCASNLSGQGGALDQCNTCFAAKGIWTAVGCIEQDPKSLIGKIINIGIGILGGVFLLRVLSAAFNLTVSQGDVKRTTEAKEMLTESIIGVLFILFSVTILQFIGSGVLHIPGFG